MSATTPVQPDLGVELTHSDVRRQVAHLLNETARLRAERYALADAEREACAKLVADSGMASWPVREALAAMIRARGAK